MGKYAAAVRGTRPRAPCGLRGRRAVWLLEVRLSHPQVAGLVFPLFGQFLSRVNLTSIGDVCGEKGPGKPKVAATQRQFHRGLSSAATRVSKSQRALGQGHRFSPAISADLFSVRRASSLKSEAGAGGISGAGRRHRRRSCDRHRTGSDPVGQPSPAPANAWRSKSGA